MIVVLRTGSKTGEKTFFSFRGILLDISYEGALSPGGYAGELPEVGGETCGVDQFSRRPGAALKKRKRGLLAVRVAPPSKRMRRYCCRAPL
jgi:hypothetical protein